MAAEPPPIADVPDLAADLLESLQQARNDRYSIEVKRNERGSWCVYIDGRFISDHATHTAARATAQLHVPALRAQWEAEHPAVGEPT